MTKCAIQNILFLTIINMFIVGCATTKSPLKIEIIIEQAHTAYKAKQWAIAEQKYAQLVVLTPGQAEFWFKLGNIYAHTNQPDKAISAYKEVVIREPKLAKAWHNLSVMSLRQTTHLFIEMLKYIDPKDPLFNKAKKTGEDLISILKTRRNTKKIQLGDYPLTIPANKETKPAKHE